MQLIDTHAHLSDDQFGADLDTVLERAHRARVTQIIAVGADLHSSRAALGLAERLPGVYATVGIHPHAAREASPAVLDALRELSAHPRVVAVGEIGLDFYRDLSPRESQRKAFVAQLALAAEVGKPVVIHIRDSAGQSQAYVEVLAILSDWVSQRTAGSRGVDLPDRGPQYGVLHCYSGELSVARSALQLGFCVGVDGPVTYPNAQSLRDLVAQLPLDRLLLETDCPYLAPQAHRGRRNEPAYLVHIAQQVAELQGCDLETVARVTSATSGHLFGLRHENGEVKNLA